VRIHESLHFDAPVDVVWEFLQDIPRVAGCMPGLESVRQTGPDEFTAEFKVSVGPVKARFAGKATIAERKPPEKIGARIEGNDPGSATSVKADFTGVLSPAGSGTALEVTMEVALRGRLAQFGSAVVLATSKKLTAAFAERMRAAMTE
jgi:carbon monoxide dehydrogenase subunit G